MADHTDIEWTDATWNPITGCSVISPGCTNCYAMRLAGTRLARHSSRAGLTRDTKAGPVWTGEVRFNEQWIDLPLKWRRPRHVFVCAHGDLFHESVPDQWIDRVFAVMAAAHWHTFQVLTKRAERMREYLRDDGAPAAERWVAASWQIAKESAALASVGWSWAGEGMPWPLPNVWLGVSAEDQRRADARIPHLLATPAAVRWISTEPLLGPVDLRQINPPEGETRRVDALKGETWYPGCGSINSQTILSPPINWVVAGGESGPGARPMHPDWARALRDQCARAGVPFFFKQWGEWGLTDERRQNVPHAVARDGTLYREADLSYPNGARYGEAIRARHAGQLHTIYPVGKTRAGRLLDGREHNGMPGDA